MRSPREGGGVDQDVVVGAAQRFQGAFEAKFALFELQKLDLGAVEVGVGGENEQSVDKAWAHGLQGGGRVDEDVVDRQAALFESHVGGHVGLGIHVDQEHPAIGGGQAGAKVHGRRGFADAALLIDETDHAHRGFSLFASLVGGVQRGGGATRKQENRGKGLVEGPFPQTLGRRLVFHVKHAPGGVSRETIPPKSYFFSEPPVHGALLAAPELSPAAGAASLLALSAALCPFECELTLAGEAFCFL